ncbi:PLP-dependent transferase [Melanomma pulvis-pyrius CBS 109.77]|uniref:PLP-dependent transferase n=1 Tax=Melanomma pulvis-pyrius CBS 109.77 TaxID=1314802 RepID=A0A6A6XHY0_9PLEO|nr:PLP-dependent transferase [Melanomma pulvis-pyrius CBS 109.77]
MLSSRGKVNADQLDIPWRFALGTKYDLETNPLGIILLRNRRYSAGGPRFPAVLTTHLTEYFPPHEPLVGTDIGITSAATALHEVLAYSVAEPRGGILTSWPFYGRFELDFGNKAQLKVVCPETYAETCFQPDVVQVFEEALAKSNAEGLKIRAPLVVYPHNPLGRCYPKDTLIALMKFCEKHQIHFISDEVYGVSVFVSGEPDVVPSTSDLATDLTGIIDRNLLHVTYAMTKDFGADGLRLGALITRNEQLKKAFLAVVRCRRTAVASKFVTGRLREMGVPYLTERELVDAGVFLHPVEEHSLVLGRFRLVYIVERSIVDEWLRR